jgi:hypothetical protein
MTQSYHSHILNGTSRTYVITTQNVECYGGQNHKFKGGSTYSLHFHVTMEEWDEESMYEVPSLSEASAAALVMKHVNRFNGLHGSFDYITNIEVVVSPFDTPDHPTWNGHVDKLIEEIEDAQMEVA